MRYVADLHIHSLYSRATSKQSTLQGLAAWAGIKGIDLVGTGDFTHPGWFEHLTKHLVEAEPGFFRLKKPSPITVLDSVESPGDRCRFVLTAEISSIYKRDGRVRKIHNILVVPDLASARSVAAVLGSIGNISSDGRPILGLDAHDLLEILLEKAPDGFLIPAHIWTPWFSLFGSKSGFDAIEECFDDLTPHIFALETGLSSDPPMNRLISALDRFTLVSNSDCHSPSKLGREANLFDADFDYYAMKKALQDPAQGFLGTIEFFPEEGKYHLDGHRKCDIIFSPKETRSHDGICPVCQRPVTVGVMHRVMDLADRDTPLFQKNGPRFHSLIPLAEVIGEIMGRGPATKGVMREYARVITQFGSEFNILLHANLEDIRENGSMLLAEAVGRMRRGKVHCQGGFDGEFGVIRAFAPGEIDQLAGQKSVFRAQTKRIQKRSANSAAKTHKKKPSSTEENTAVCPTKRQSSADAKNCANQAQEKALSAVGRHVLVTAGPGTGKTYTLVTAVKRLIESHGREVRPLVITFTNRAADEVAERLADTQDIKQVHVATFHSFALENLRRRTSLLHVIDAAERQRILAGLFPRLTAKDLARVSEEISDAYVHGKEAVAPGGPCVDYETFLQKNECIDLDGVVPRLLQYIDEEVFFIDLCSRVTHLFVDEFQDLNQPQYQLVVRLADLVPVFAIGDPDQAIYGFRGASPRFFFKFQTRFSPTIVTLDHNYRSTQSILQASHAVIRHNKATGLNHPLKAHDSSLDKIFVHSAETPDAEAEYIVAAIERLMGGISSFSINSGRGGDEDNLFSFQDIAILYRLNMQARPIAQALERRGIPFQVAGVPAFYREKGAGCAYQFFLIAAGIATDAEHEECRRQIGKTTATGLGALITVFTEKRKEKGIRYLLEQYALDLGVDTDSQEYEQLLQLAGLFNKDLHGCAAYLRRHENGMEFDERAQAVALMSIHAAKGLEFGAVFLAGVEEELLPCTILKNDSDRDGSHEEERRLFYVGMTRARKKLSLSWCRKRILYGGRLTGKPSPFLSEIPAEQIKESIHNGPAKKRPQGRQLSIFD